MNKLILCVTALVLLGCSKKEQVDLIVINANVYTVNNDFGMAEAFAVKDGKFLEIGLAKSITDKYDSDKIINAEGKTILPGLIDAHCHFVSLGQLQQRVNLIGTTSFEDMVQRVVNFQKKHNLSYLKGRGWDQNDWKNKEMPSKTVLDSLFPDIPVALTRVDGHAVLCNQSALDLGNVTIETKIDGGEIVIDNDELTGVLIDNAEQLVENNWPKPTTEELTDALLKAQDICLSLGLTSLSDAGPDTFTTPLIDTINLIDSLQKSGDLKIRLYMMVPGTEINLNHFLNKGIIKTNKLNVRSFKFYADGALGSRGALLRKPYNDKQHSFGIPVMSLEAIKTGAMRIANSEFQMNTHAIGDSANHEVLITYKNALKGKPNRRWRIEHAQVVSQDDFKFFDDIIPSVQPTHATSDMYWAEDRVGGRTNQRSLCI